MSPFMDETTTDYGAVRLASDVAETKQCALNVRVATDHMFPTGKTFRKRGSIRHSIKLFLTFAIPISCPNAGIGRQAWLRAMCPYGRAGSTPVSGTFYKTSE